MGCALQSEPLHIAIDGPAGSGKSSIAAELARRLGLAHVDTGALYRALAFCAIQESIDANDGAALAARLARLQLAFADGRLEIDGVDRSQAIRAKDVTALVSRVAAQAPVRAQMLRLQRRLAESAPAGAVMEGRDIGSTVLPLAPCKIYLDARPLERARRRLLQQGEPAEGAALEHAIVELRERDRQDTEREHSPLAIAPDAHVLDTSQLSFESVLTCCQEFAQQSRLVDAATPESQAQREHDGLYRSMHDRLTRPLLMRCFGLTVHGAVHERFKGSLIYACNHVSNFDPLVAGSGIEREVWFMAKRELFFWPLGPLIRRFHAIPMERRRFDRAAFAKAATLLAEGQNVLIFPEGTRRPVGRPGPIKRGLGILAMDSGRPYLPLLVVGSDRPLRALLRRGPLQLWIGPVTQLRALPALRQQFEDSKVQSRIGALYLAQLLALYERAERHAEREKPVRRP